jgi:hypothetical protein
MNLPPNLLSAFITVFVTIGPIETAVVFAAPDRRRASAGAQEFGRPVG